MVSLGATVAKLSVEACSDCGICGPRFQAVHHRSACALDDRVCTFAKQVLVAVLRWLSEASEVGSMVSLGATVAKLSVEACSDFRIRSPRDQAVHHRSAFGWGAAGAAGGGGGGGGTSPTA